MKCSECGKWVWWWQQSRVTFDPIHMACHLKMLEEAWGNSDKRLAEALKILRGSK